jgi:hypothetical protein
VAELRGVNQRGHGVAQDWEHSFEPRVEEQRFLVAHEEMIELHVKVRDVNGEPEQVGGDFIDGGHIRGVLIVLLFGETLVFN